MNTGELFSTKVCFLKPLTMKAILISGLKPSMLCDAPKTKEALQRMLNFIDKPNSILITHNGSKYDNRYSIQYLQC